jgi:ketosteroid isomerase-like protein
MSRENVEIVRWIYERFNQRDDAVWEVMDEAEIRFPDWSWATEKQTYKGREAIEFFADTFSVFLDFRMYAERLVDAGNYAVATIHNIGRGKGSGVDIDMRTAVLYEFRDGKVVRVEVYGTRAEALEAAGLRE